MDRSYIFSTHKNRSVFFPKIMSKIFDFFPVLQRTVIVESVMGIFFYEEKSSLLLSASILYFIYSREKLRRSDPFWMLPRFCKAFWCEQLKILVIKK